MKSKRHTPLEISKAEFKKVGYQLIDSIADFINTIDERPVTTGKSPQTIATII